MKRFAAAIAAICVFLTSYAGAYNVVDPPESMSFAEAMGIFDASEVTYATISDIDDGSFIELDSTQIADFYETAKNIRLYRTINPTPFRATAINLYTNDGIMSYYPASGVQVALYGSDNYVCYAAKDEGAAYLTVIDSLYRDAETKYPGEEIHRNTTYDFLKLPTLNWAVEYVKDAAQRNIMPFELVNKYNQSISREDFCVLVGRMITVLSGCANLESYVQDKQGAYLKDIFADCSGRSEEIDMLYALGVVSGVSDTQFSPDGEITREQAATLITRAAGLFCYVNADAASLNFSDASRISDWARYYVKWVSDKQIMNGVNDGEFDPTSAYSVEQAITTVVRLYDYISGLE